MICVTLPIPAPASVVVLLSLLFLEAVPCTASDSELSSVIRRESSPISVGLSVNHRRLVKRRHFFPLADAPKPQSYLEVTASGSLLQEANTSAKQNLDEDANQITQGDLVFDIGFNLGGDSRTYMQQGYRVLGVEGNTDLVQAAKKDTFFAPRLANRRLQLLNNGVVEEPGQAPIDFWRYDGEEGVWGRLGSPHPRCKECKNCCQVLTKVETVSCEQLMQRHGVPVYMKIDIETNDVPCIMGISLKRHLNNLPRFISFEASLGDFDHNTYRALIHLRCLGFSKFKLQAQSQLNVRSEDFPAQTSGPFGFWAVDSSRGSLLWRKYEDFLASDHTCPTGDWCDVHAMRPDPEQAEPLPDFCSSSLENGGTAKL